MNTSHNRQHQRADADSVAKLAGNGYIEGYPDGNFGGDRLMTRYEFAAMLYRAIEKGAALEEKIIKIDRHKRIAFLKSSDQTKEALLFKVGLEITEKTSA